MAATVANTIERLKNRLRGLQTSDPGGSNPTSPSSTRRAPAALASNSTSTAAAAPAPLASDSTSRSVPPPSAPPAPPAGGATKPNNLERLRDLIDQLQPSVPLAERADACLALTYLLDAVYVPDELPDLWTLVAQLGDRALPKFCRAAVIAFIKSCVGSRMPLDATLLSTMTEFVLDESRWADDEICHRLVVLELLQVASAPHAIPAHHHVVELCERWLRAQWVHLNTTEAPASGDSAERVLSPVAKAAGATPGSPSMPTTQQEQQAFHALSDAGPVLQLLLRLLHAKENLIAPALLEQIGRHVAQLALTPPFLPHLERSLQILHRLLETDLMPAETLAMAMRVCAAAYHPDGPASETPVRSAVLLIMTVICKEQRRTSAVVLSMRSVLQDIVAEYTHTVSGVSMMDASESMMRLGGMAHAGTTAAPAGVTTAGATATALPSLRRPLQEMSRRQICGTIGLLLWLHLNAPDVLSTMLILRLIRIPLDLQDLAVDLVVLKQLRNFLKTHHILMIEIQLVVQLLLQLNHYWTPAVIDALPYKLGDDPPPPLLADQAPGAIATGEIAPTAPLIHQLFGVYNIIVLCLIHPSPADPSAVLALLRSATAFGHQLGDTLVSRIVQHCEELTWYMQVADGTMELAFLVNQFLVAQPTPQVAPAPAPALRPPRLRHEIMDHVIRFARISQDPQHVYTHLLRPIAASLPFEQDPAMLQKAMQALLDAVATSADPDAVCDLQLACLLCLARPRTPAQRLAACFWPAASGHPGGSHLPPPFHDAPSTPSSARISPAFEHIAAPDSTRFPDTLARIRAAAAVETLMALFLSAAVLANNEHTQRTYLLLTQAVTCVFLQLPARQRLFKFLLSFRTSDTGYNIRFELPRFELLDAVTQSRWSPLHVTANGLVQATHLYASTADIYQLNEAMHMPLSHLGPPGQLVSEMPISAHVALGQLRVDLYLEVLITLLCEPCPYPLFQQLLDELPQQLANLPLWHEAIREIRTLRSVLCSMVLKERAFENITDVPPALAKTTVYRQLIYVLLILLPFHQHFNRQQHEELVMVFQTGLSKWPVANKLCIHALQVCLYEFPSLMTKALPGLLMKISQNMATSMGIPNLEFLAALADLPALTRNLTETDYRRILAIGLQHINNVSPPHDATPATKASLVYLEQLAFYVITLWFTSIRLMDRRRYVPFIIHYLQRDTSVTEEENRANTQLVMDMLITSTFANCWSRTKQRSIASSHVRRGRSLNLGGMTLGGGGSMNLPNSATSSGVMATPGMPLGGAAAPLTKAWLFNNCIMTMTMIDDRWCEIWIRRPSGLVSFTIHLDNPLKEHTHSATMTTAHAMAADSGSGGGGRDASSATGLGMPPAATFPELPPILAYQHLFDAAFPSAAAAPTSASPFGDLRSPPPPPSAPSPASVLDGRPPRPPASQESQHPPAAGLFPDIVAAGTAAAPAAASTLQPLLEESDPVAGGHPRSATAPAAAVPAGSSDARASTGSTPAATVDGGGSPAAPSSPPPPAAPSASAGTSAQDSSTGPPAPRSRARSVQLRADLSQMGASAAPGPLSSVSADGALGPGQIAMALAAQTAGPARVDPSFHFLQFSGISSLSLLSSDPSHLAEAHPLAQRLEPIQLPEDDAVRRALGVLDRTPVVDLHKIGVTYVATGQSHEREILLNEHGSRAYSLFLQSMGRMAKLRGNHDIYTGGLDIEHDIDGEYAIYWQDDLSQLILHSTTLMPSGTPQPAATAEPAALLSSSSSSLRGRPPAEAAAAATPAEASPRSRGVGGAAGPVDSVAERFPLSPSQEAALINKKRHIGNDYVLIVWNDSGMPYRFETIPGQFNLVNIVITPAGSASVKDEVAQNRLPAHAVDGSTPSTVTPGAITTPGTATTTSISAAAAGVAASGHDAPTSSGDPTDGAPPQPPPASVAAFKPFKPPPQQRTAMEGYSDLYTARYFRITVQTRPDLPEMAAGLSAPQRILSGFHVAGYVRRIAMHANVLAQVFLSIHLGHASGGFYASSRERLRQIEAIRRRALQGYVRQGMAHATSSGGGGGGSGPATPGTPGHPGMGAKVMGTPGAVSTPPTAGASTPSMASGGGGGGAPTSAGPPPPPLTGAAAVERAAADLLGPGVARARPAAAVGIGMAPGPAAAAGAGASGHLVFGTTAPAGGALGLLSGVGGVGGVGSSAAPSMVPLGGSVHGGGMAVGSPALGGLSGLSGLSRPTPLAGSVGSGVPTSGGPPRPRDVMSMTLDFTRFT